MPDIEWVVPYMDDMFYIKSRGKTKLISNEGHVMFNHAYNIGREHSNKHIFKTTTVNSFYPLVATFQMYNSS